MKLLTYSSKKYLWLSALLVLFSIPVFYLVANSLFLNTADRELREKASLTSKHTNQIKNVADLELWKTLNNDIEISLFKQNEFRQAPFTIEIINPATGDFQDYRCLQKQISIFGIRHTITFKESLIKKKELIRSILLVQISLLLLLFLGFFIINKVISKKIWAPFQKIRQYIKDYQPTKEEEIMEERLEIDEFDDLNIDIKNLLQRTQTAYQLQKEFTENAAHELQTPVAIIKSKLDLLLQEKELSNKQSQLIDQIYYVLQKLSDLNKNMLFLTKIENQQFEFNDEVNCAETVSAVMDNLSFFAEAKYQQVLFPRPQAKFFKGNQSLFDQLVQNLMINAIQYSPKGSIINIFLTDDNLSFVNEGTELGFSDEQLFSRFSKTIEKDQKGNGLGLAICKKIALVHGFDLGYRYDNGKHHFTVYFKQKS